MTASKTATVETLTAEVRVLTVGSRQVTAGIYWQLDRLGPSDIEPFGRVQLRGCDEWKIYVVGKQVGSSDLIRSDAAEDDPLVTAWWDLRLIVLAGLR